MMKKIIWLLLIIMFLTSSTPQTTSGLTYKQYTNEFVISGTYNIIDQIKLSLEGKITLISSINKTHLNYHLKYDTTALSSTPVFEFTGEGNFTEDLDDKMLTSNYRNGSNIQFIWDIFSPTVDNPIYSIFRLLDSEVESKFPKLLNYTTNLIDTKDFVSIEYGKKISSYYVTFETYNGVIYQLYYDTRFQVLIAFDIFLTDEFLQNGSEIHLFGEIKSSSLDLPLEDEIFELRILIISGASIFLLVSGLIGYFRIKAKSKTVIDGGL